jgi:hypothetical protein
MSKVAKSVSSVAGDVSGDVASTAAKKTSSVVADAGGDAASTTAKKTSSGLSAKNTAIAGAGVGVASGVIVGGGVDNVVSGVASVLGIPDLSTYFPYSVSSSACCCLVLVAGGAFYMFKK